MREFGRLDCMFNNAGIVGTHGGIDEIPIEEYEFTMTVLLRSVFLGMKHAARVMKPQHSGVILSTTSIGGLQGGLGPHIYVAAKGAVVALTRNVAAELGAWSIRVNAIAPGKILTPMNATNLIGDPDAMDEAREAFADPDSAARPDRRGGGHRARRLVAGQRRRRVRQRPHPGRRRRPDDRVEENVAPGEHGRWAEADATWSARRVAAACRSWRTGERGERGMSAAATDALAALPGYSDLGPDDLILSHFSLGRSRPFEERVRAAAEAGFAAMGLYIGEYQRLRAEGARDADLRSVLDHYGVPLVEIEALRGWSATGADRATYLQTERSVFAMSDALGPGHHVQVIGPYTGTLDDAAEAFAGVCDRAAEHGLAAAIEFLPEMSNIPDAATAMQIVTRAGRANGGICLDCWHHFRGANDDDMLRAIPVERIFTRAVQRRAAAAGRPGLLHRLHALSGRAGSGRVRPRRLSRPAGGVGRASPAVRRGDLDRPPAAPGGRSRRAAGRHDACGRRVGAGCTGGDGVRSPRGS